MQLLTFVASRRFRWPLALVLVVAALVTLFVTRAESSAPFGIALLAAFVAWDG